MDAALIYNLMKLMGQSVAEPNNTFQVYNALIFLNLKLIFVFLLISSCLDL